jgi:hypothetical protein
MSASIDILSASIYLLTVRSEASGRLQPGEDRTMFPFAISDWLDALMAAVLAITLLHAWAGI